MNLDAAVPNGLATLADVLLKGGALLIFAFAAARVVRRRSAAERGLIWGLALGGLLVLAGASPFAPKWSWAVLPAGWGGVGETVNSFDSVDQVAESQTVALAPDGPDRSYGSYRSYRTYESNPSNEGMQPASPKPAAFDPAENEPPSVQTQRASSLPSPPVVIREEPLPSAGREIPWRAIVLAAWGMGVLAALAPLALGLAQARRRIRRAKPLVGEDWTGLINELRGKLGIVRPVRLLLGRPGEMPMAAGWVNAAILLPAEANAWPDPLRRAVLAHELAHVRRRDCLTHALGRLAAALHWPDPLAWIALARLRAEREQACDDLALAAGSPAPDYADSLLAVARTTRARMPLAAAVATMARPSRIEGRLLAILDSTRRREGVGRRGILIGFAAMLLVALPLSMAQLEQSGAAFDANGADAHRNPDPVLRYLAWETRDDQAWNMGRSWTSPKARAIWTPDGTAVAPGGIGIHPQTTFFVTSGNGHEFDPPKTRYLLAAFAFGGEAPAWSELKLEESEGVRQRGARSGEDTEQEGLAWQTYTLAVATTATLSSRVVFNLTYPAGDWREAGTLPGTPAGPVDLGDGLSAQAVRDDDPKFPGVRVEIVDAKSSVSRMCKAEFVPNRAGRRAIERGAAGGWMSSDAGPMEPGKRTWSNTAQLLPEMIDRVRILTKPLKTARFEARLLPFAEEASAAASDEAYAALSLPPTEIGLKAGATSIAPFPIDGGEIANADIRPASGPRPKSFVVHLEFLSATAIRYMELKHSDRARRVAISVNGRVIAAPVAEVNAQPGEAAIGIAVSREDARFLVDSIKGGVEPPTASPNPVPEDIARLRLRIETQASYPSGKSPVVIFAVPDIPELERKYQYHQHSGTDAASPREGALWRINGKEYHGSMFGNPLERLHGRFNLPANFLFPSKIPLPPGHYRVSLTYRNVLFSKRENAGTAPLDSAFAVDIPSNEVEFDIVAAGAPNSAPVASVATSESEARQKEIDGFDASTDVRILWRGNEIGAHGFGVASIGIGPSKWQVPGYSYALPSYSYTIPSGIPVNWVEKPAEWEMPIHLIPSKTEAGWIACQVEFPGSAGNPRAAPECHVEWMHLDADASPNAWPAGATMDVAFNSHPGQPMRVRAMLLDRSPDGLLSHNSPIPPLQGLVRETLFDRTFTLSKDQLERYRTNTRASGVQLRTYGDPAAENVDRFPLARPGFGATHHLLDPQAVCNSEDFTAGRIVPAENDPRNSELIVSIRPEAMARVRGLLDASSGRPKGLVVTLNGEALTLPNPQPDPGGKAELRFRSIPPLRAIAILREIAKTGGKVDFGGLAPMNRDTSESGMQAAFAAARSGQAASAPSPDAPSDPAARQKQIAAFFAMNDARTLWTGSKISSYGWGVEGIGLSLQKPVNTGSLGSDPAGKNGFRVEHSDVWVMQFAFLHSSKVAGQLAFQVMDDERVAGGAAAAEDYSGIFQFAGSVETPCLSFATLVLKPHPDHPFRVRVRALLTKFAGSFDTSLAPAGDMSETLFDQSFTISKEQMERDLKETRADGLQIRKLGDPAAENVERFNWAAGGPLQGHVLLDPEILLKAGEIASGRIISRGSASSIVALDLSIAPGSSARLQKLLNGADPFHGNAVAALNGEALMLNLTAPGGGSFSNFYCEAAPKELAEAILREIAKAGGKADFGIKPKSDSEAAAGRPLSAEANALLQLPPTYPPMRRGATVEAPVTIDPQEIANTGIRPANGGKSFLVHLDLLPPAAQRLDGLKRTDQEPRVTIAIDGHIVTAPVMESNFQASAAAIDIGVSREDARFLVESIRGASAGVAAATPAPVAANKVTPVPSVSPEEAARREWINASFAVNDSRVLWKGSAVGARGFGVEAIGLRPKGVVNGKVYFMNQGKTTETRSLRPELWILDFMLVISNKEAEWAACQVEFPDAPAERLDPIERRVSWLRLDPAETTRWTNMVLRLKPHPDRHFRVRVMALKRSPEGLSDRSPVPEEMIEETLFDRQFTVTKEMLEEYLKEAREDGFQIRWRGSPADAAVERFPASINSGYEDRHCLVDPIVRFTALDFTAASAAPGSPLTTLILRPEAPSRLNAIAPRFDGKPGINAALLNNEVVALAPIELTAQGDRPAIRMEAMSPADAEAIVREIDSANASARFQVRREAASQAEDGVRLPLAPQAGPGEAGTFRVRREVLLDARAIASAELSPAPDGKTFGFKIEFQPGAAKRFGELTRENSGKRIAFIVDGRVVAAPRIEAQIESGKVVFAGGFSREEGQSLVDAIKFGPVLPADSTPSASAPRAIERNAQSNESVQTVVDSFPRDLRVHFRLVAKDGIASAVEFPSADPHSGGRMIPLEDSVLFDAKDILGASLEPESEGSSFGAAIEFRPDAAKRFGDLTRANIGRRIAIIVENRVVAASLIEAPIDSGKLVVAGGFSREEAQSLVDAIKGGEANGKIHVTRVGGNGEGVALPKMIAAIKSRMEGLRKRKIRLEYTRKLSDGTSNQCVLIAHGGDYRETESWPDGRVVDHYLSETGPAASEWNAGVRVDVEQWRGAARMTFHEYSFIHWADGSFPRQWEEETAVRFEKARKAGTVDFKTAIGGNGLTLSSAGMAYASFDPSMNWAYLGEEAPYAFSDFTVQDGILFPRRCESSGRIDTIVKIDLDAKFGPEELALPKPKNGDAVKVSLYLWDFDDRKIGKDRGSVSVSPVQFVWGEPLSGEARRQWIVAQSRWRAADYLQAVRSGFPIPWMDRARNTIIWAKHDDAVQGWINVHEGDALPASFGPAPWTDYLSKWADAGSSGK